ncbi:hypothetical protein WN71_007940 [Streptomyces mangrovisoli]|uniref:Lipocalin-like domain-containing protein n=1 Tax=Streptomyces mangrovisoli TaxID=1428628 RepID=A0A1J4P0S0_9ACTN|nr:hypothetical protein WN71_007940 [Streptomyces mangrovisoli]
MMMSVSACGGWGGYPAAKNVHESQLVGTWRDPDCGTEVTLKRDGSASATGIPTEMELDGKVTQKVGGAGTWEIGEFRGDQQLEVAAGDTYITFDLYSDKGRLLVGLTVGDPDDMNWCILTRKS